MKNTERLKTVTGEELMSEPIRPPNLIVDSLLSQGLENLLRQVAEMDGDVTYAQEPVWDTDS